MSKNMSFGGYEKFKSHKYCHLNFAQYDIALS